jgi:hypothetical protein
MDLTPQGHNALGRTEFMIHGESRANPPGNASEGCMIFPRDIREQMSRSGDRCSMSFAEHALASVLAGSLLTAAVAGCKPNDESKDREAVPLSPESTASNARAASLNARIEAVGAREVVRQLIGTGEKEGHWETVLERAESGDREWIDVVGRLAAGTDAGSSTDVKVALANALPKNPAAVFKQAGSVPYLQVQDLCGGPFIEPELDYLKDFYARVKQALEAPLAQEFKESAAHCKRAVEAGLADIERQMQPTRPRESNP